MAGRSLFFSGFLCFRKSGKRQSIVCLNLQWVPELSKVSGSLECEAAAPKSFSIPTPTNPKQTMSLAKELECEQKNLEAGIFSRKRRAKKSLTQGKPLRGRRRTPSAPHPRGIFCGMSHTEPSTHHRAFKGHVVWQLKVAAGDAPPIRQAKNRGKISLCWRQWESCHWLRPGPGVHSRIPGFFSQVIYHNCFYLAVS